MEDESSVSPPTSVHPAAELGSSNDGNKIRFRDFFKFEWSYFGFSSSSSCSSSSSSSLRRKLSIPMASFFLVFFFIIALVYSLCSDSLIFAGPSMTFTYYMQHKNYTKKEEYLLTCPSTQMNITCPANYPPSNHTIPTSNKACPDYFRWIHEDMKTWKRHGISRDMVESLKHNAHFRLVIVNGTAYVKQYNKAYQSRDVYTLWGILQLLKLYPGRLPDLDLMFQCHDQSSIKRHDYLHDHSAPPQFHYCGDDSTLDIVFPDWSFWGWPEINIKPWVPLMKDLEAGNKMMNWTSREPFAFWKGNLYTGARKKLEDCNSIQRWNAEIVNQDWIKESNEGYKNSDLSKQCLHRYKIYIEGNAWSVSEKYILACDSTSLFVNPNYYDFFSRSLIPLTHYWPIDPHNLCKSIKFAVDWGNINPAKAQEIGKAGTEYIFNQVKIENVYDYMFHVLNEYAKLFTYTPTVPEGAVELCSEKFACSPMGLETTYKVETMVHGPADHGPCALPPPYKPKQLQQILNQNDKIKKQVQMREQQKN